MGSINQIRLRTAGIAIALLLIVTAPAKSTDWPLIYNVNIENFWAADAAAFEHYSDAMDFLDYIWEAIAAEDYELAREFYYSYGFPVNLTTSLSNLDSEAEECYLLSSNVRMASFNLYYMYVNEEIEALPENMFTDAQARLDELNAMVDALYALENELAVLDIFQVTHEIAIESGPLPVWLAMSNLETTIGQLEDEIDAITYDYGYLWYMYYGS